MRRCTSSRTRVRGVGPRASAPRSGERGVTLIELMIAVSLTAVISVGLLFALRTSVLAYEKTGDRLRFNREQINRNQILTRELGAAMPVSSICPTGAPVPAFAGTPTSLRMISSYSIAEGFRGYPQMLDFHVVRARTGAVQLVVTEQPYTGPVSAASFCGAAAAGGAPGAFEFPGGGGAPFVLADDLISCEFSYHEPVNMLAYQDSGWTTQWLRNVMPAAVRVEMKPRGAPGGALPVVSVTVPLHTDRDVFRNYADQ